MLTLKHRNCDSKITSRVARPLVPLAKRHLGLRRSPQTASLVNQPLAPQGQIPSLVEALSGLRIVPRPPLRLVLVHSDSHRMLVPQVGDCSEGPLDSPKTSSSNHNRRTGSERLVNLNNSSNNNNNNNNPREVACLVGVHLARHRTSRSGHSVSC